MAVGTVHMACGLEFGSTLILFFLAGSKLTKWRSELKERLDAAHVPGGQRSAAQVLANSLGGAALAVATVWLRSAAASSPSLARAAAVASTAFVGFYACCCGDTFSSEAGIAASSPPRLITSGRRVPPGTNGGVSLLGIAAAGAGGLMMGACYSLAAWASATWSGAAAPGGPAATSACLLSSDWRLVPLAGAAGVAGSLLDSLLGATLQYSGYDERSGKAVSRRPHAGQAGSEWVRHTSGLDVLSNTQVNVISSLLTAALMGAFGARLLDASCAV